MPKNIETITEGGTQRQKYYYDSLNQLIREDNLDLNKTVTYTYDKGGNLQSSKEYAYQTGSTVTGTPTKTNTYSYTDSNWKDKLTAYNGNGITYDAIGNPASYYNGFSFTWDKGRQLSSASDGTTVVSYTYNESGIRDTKTVNGVTSYYTLEGSLVQFERCGTSHIWYYYDGEGSPVAMRIGTSRYLYRKNLQGDITGIYSGSSGALLVSYVYDAWGKPVITDVAGTTESARLVQKNPYLYRGYRYDHETGLYYLNSRYYDPETGRWINADAVIAEANTSVKGCNLFAFCFNNPVNMKDPTGNWPEWIKDAVKWVAESIVKPVVIAAEEALAKVDLTYSVGYNVSGTPSAVIFNGQIGISIDTKGSIALQASIGGGFTTGNKGISVSRYHSITNAPNIDSLTEDFCQTGGSIAKPIGNVPVYVGGDLMIMDKNKPKSTRFGMTGNLGFGTPGTEAHVEWGRTFEIPYTSINVFKFARFVYRKVMEW